MFLLSNIASLFSLYKITRAPGTMASLITLIFLVTLNRLGIYPNFSITNLIILSGIAYFFIYLYMSNSKTSKSGKNVSDPREVVIDEVIGQIIAFLSICNICIFRDALISFILFRFFDIVKPFPINFIESKIGGNFGILLDDILAGIMALICKFYIVKILSMLISDFSLNIFDIQSFLDLFHVPR